MKSVLIIGTGRLGHHLCTNMAHMGNEVMIVDKNEESMQDLLSVAVMAKVGDCMKEDVLRSTQRSTVYLFCVYRIGFSEQSGDYKSAQRNGSKICGQQGKQRHPGKISSEKWCG